jgi:hypothetical protein
MIEKLKKLKNKVEHIHEAWTHDLPVGEDWYEKRLEACRTCPLMSANVEKKSIVQNIRESIGGIFKDDHCTICGCPIARKASVKAESCADENNKKWDALAVGVSSNKNAIFAVEKIETAHNYEIIEELGSQVLELDASEKDVLQFSFKVQPPEGVKYLRHTASCSCTVPKVRIETDGSLIFEVKVSQVNFTPGIRNRKNVAIYYEVGNSEHMLVVRFTCKKKKKDEL